MKKIGLILLLIFQANALSTIAQNNFQGSYQELNFADEIDLKWLALYYRSFKNGNEELTQNYTSINAEEIKKNLNYLKERTPLPLQYNPIIENVIRLYLTDGLETLENIKDRSAYFFPVFDSYLAQYNLPLEMKYLAVVESALKTDALSHSGARGIWQFMLGTARMYQLKIDSYVDERKDIFSSTKAACEYLSVLHSMFGDWNLAIAAYNCGPGNVTKAIRRAGGQKDYWQIRPFLPKETQAYVPAFYATLYIFEQSDKYLKSVNQNGISFFETDTIHVKKQLNLNEIEKHLQIKNQLLSQLNPKYTKNVIPKNEYLTLPKSLVSNFIQFESGLFNDNQYVEIVKNTHTPEHKKEIIELNNSKQTELGTVRKSDFKIETYVVKEGDSLFKISRLYPNVSINQLRTWNNIWGVNYVKPGTKLLIYKS
ncbi:lytic transglycosylase domain-containing protein [Namhaeicola litoreus]|uniref:Transglycosylase SLT domain-containing protein n=1 Tax=Namhaeicola litoreus TaxID=1052145 RepID=A0ABW3XZ26_9FLAO